MKAIIIGNTQFSSLLLQYVRDDGIDVAAFAADREYIDAGSLDSVPVVPIDELPARFDTGEDKLIMGIGYKKLGEIRKALFERCRDYGFDFINYIHPSAVVDRSVLIGEGNIIFENVTVQKRTVMGDCNILFSNCAIMHDNVVGSFVTFGAGCVSNGSVHIGNCCFIGSNATLRDRIRIRDHILIGAGTYVERDCDAGTAVLPGARTYLQDGAARMENGL